MFLFLHLHEDYSCISLLSWLDSFLSKFIHGQSGLLVSTLFAPDSNETINAFQYMPLSLLLPRVDELALFVGVRLSSPLLISLGIVLFWAILFLIWTHHTSPKRMCCHCQKTVRDTGPGRKAESDGSEAVMK